MRCFPFFVAAIPLALGGKPDGAIAPNAEVGRERDDRCIARLTARPERYAPEIGARAVGEVSGVASDDDIVDTFTPGGRNW